MHLDTVVLWFVEDQAIYNILVEKEREKLSCRQGHMVWCQQAADFLTSKGTSDFPSLDLIKDDGDTDTDLNDDRDSIGSNDPPPNDSETASESSEVDDSNSIEDVGNGNALSPSDESGASNGHNDTDS